METLLCQAGQVKVDKERVWLAFICMQLYGYLVRMEEELDRR